MPNLTVRNRDPFAVENHFDAGWLMEHAEIVSILGATFERFSTNRVLDVGNTGVLSGVSFTDTNCLPLQGGSLVNSRKRSANPIFPANPEPANLVSIATTKGAQWTWIGKGSSCDQHLMLQPSFCRSKHDPLGSTRASARSLRTAKK